ncbi:hypothetical protein NliqN6_2641 [Naganishia liquefaciens]|uniref:Amino acid transporter transmembrane domain-containing protein n=1 Tax=Naganishia liquefaciens TaxID=104408 RepID=A0A8H3TU59_9TREE|nr:hypothetical protein NliqN6_2641 [Naganishia liquefaciens]
MADIEKRGDAVLVDDDNFGTETGSLKANRAIVTAPEFEQDIFAAQANRDDGDYVEFRTMGWVQAGLVALAEGIALGTLSFPSIFMRLGIFGGVIATVGLGALAWLAASWMVDFKRRFPATMNYADAAFVIYGKWGYRICAFGMVAKSIGLAASHVLAGKIALNNMSENATCQLVFSIVTMVISVLLSLQRHFGKLTIISIISVTCIVTASFITVIATGVQPDAHLIKNGKPIVWYTFNRDATLSDVIGALTNICFTYGGGMACFTFASEMKNPNDFKKSYALVQIGSVIVYVLVGCLIYVFGGQYTTSPALTMTSHPVSTTAYALAYVTIIVSGVVAVNVGAKLLYVMWLRDSPLLTSGSWKAQLWWIGIVIGMWIIGWVLAELIPFFNSLLTIVSSLFSTWFAFGLASFLWFHLRKISGKGLTGGWLINSLLIAAVFMIIFSTAITPLGIYSAIDTIIAGYRKGSYSHPFQC